MSLRKAAFGFAPTSITGCKLWLDGVDPAGNGVIPANGATVSTWNDKSGNGYNAAATGTPTYLTGGGVNFNGSPYFLNQTFSQNLSQRSIFIVMQETVHNNYFGVFPIIPSPNTASGGDGGEGTGLSIETTNGLRFYGNSGGYQSDIGNSTLLTKSIYNDNMNGTAGSGFLNGNSATTNTASYTAGTCSGYGIGGRWLSGAMNASYRLNGVIFEIIYFNSPLGTTDRRNVEGYLAQKWGITTSLPVGHPGLTTSIYRTDYIKNSVVVRNVAKPIPYYTQFSPRQITGLGLWLDAADSSTVTGTSPITAWTDKSGAGRTVTITSGPTYGTTSRGGNRTMSFNNNTITTSIASAVGTGDFTLVAVWYQSAAGTNTVLSLGTVASSSQSLGFSGNKYNFYQFGDVNESAYSTATPSWVIQIGTRIGSVKKVYINGNLGTIPSSTSYDVSVTTVTIGKGDNFAISGEIGEILIYTGTMSDTNRQLLESYLAQKWGTTVSLPGGHSHFTKQVGAITTVANTKFRMVGVPRIMFTATGGTIVTSGFKYHVFTSSSNFVVSMDSKTVNYLVVGGGGGGGDRHGGGGGGGGVLSGTWTASVGTYTVTVGLGGVAGYYETANSSPQGAGIKGGNSSLSGTGVSVTANGGGGGGTYDGNPTGTVGSGGGGGGNGFAGVAGTAGQGNAGGSGLQPGGGGGGGAGGVGTNANTGTGGIGTTSYSTQLLAVGYGTSFAVPTSPNVVISGGVAYIAAGGGGAASGGPGPGGSGGLGGGGRGDWNASFIQTGTANTGSGGGGSRSEDVSTSGRDGGSGLVLLWYTV